MSLSFMEKSLWVVLIALTLPMGGYLWSAASQLTGPGAARDLVPAQALQFIGATVLMVLVLAVGHALIAIADRRTEPDERDRQIELRGERVGAFVLATGVFLALCSALVWQGNALVSHVLLGAWVLAEAVSTASQLLMHRSGS